MIRFAVLTSLIAGCGDTTSATGELGRVRYSIHTAYVVDDRPLDEVLLVTGHRQTFHTDLTEEGEKKAKDEAWSIIHRFDPSSSVDVTMWETDAEEAEESDELDEIRSFSALVGDPGAYTIESVLDGDVFDYIGVEYADPDGLELLAWVRDRGESEFELHDVSEVISVEEGAQVTFLPIPLSGDQRLVGDIATDLSASPEDAVTVGENVLGVYEQRVVSSAVPVSLYFIDPGTVTVALTDSVHGVDGVATFEVEDVGGE